MISDNQYITATINISSLGSLGVMEGIGNENGVTRKKGWESLH